MPTTLYEAARAKAASNHRSFAQVVRELLLAYVETPDAEPERVGGFELFRRPR